MTARCLAAHPPPKEWIRCDRDNPHPLEVGDDGDYRNPEHRALVAGHLIHWTDP